MSVEQPTPLWADNPATTDLLGFADIAEPILEAVGRDKLDPVAVGIFGDWGSGKSPGLPARICPLWLTCAQYLMDPPSSRRSSLAGVIDPLATFWLVTAPLRSWRVPTLPAGRLSAA